jgi:LPPG:FO 2-phospho-L-lactate transferase
VLSGGIGGARFLQGLRSLGHDVTVIGNVADDVTMLGLRICPDLDTVMYTLGDGISVERGWGREAETFRVRDELRSRWLAAGVPLSEVTRRLCVRWQPGVTLLPATDTPVETHVSLVDGRTVHFQEWWVRLHAGVAATGFEVVGAATASPGPGVVAALLEADVVLLPPSNPVVSVGAILAVPGIADALRTTAAPVVGLSPIVGGAPVRGMADACLAAIGVQTSASAVAAHYGARSDGGLLDGWLVDETDAAATENPVLPTVSVPLMMTDLEATASMAKAALALAEEVRR